jgi:hypothetical protein
VEELVGGPVDRQGSGGGVSSSDAEGNSLSYSYQGCAYELSEGGQGEVAVTRITEHDADGPVFDALEGGRPARLRRRRHRARSPIWATTPIGSAASWRC